MNATRSAVPLLGLLAIAPASALAATARITPRMGVINAVVSGPIAPEALGFIQGLSPVLAPQAALPPSSGQAAELKAISGLNGLSIEMGQALERNDVGAAQTRLEETYDFRKPSAAAALMPPAGKTAAPEKQSSGRLWSRPLIEAFVREHEKKILAVPGVAGVRVEELHGLPYLIISISDSYSMVRARVEVERGVPDVVGLKGVMGAPNQLLYEDVTVGRSPSGLIQPERPAKDSNRNETKIKDIAAAYFLQWLAGQYPQYRLLGVNPGVGLAIYSDGKDPSRCILIRVGSDGVSLVHWGSARYRSGE